MVVGLKLGLRFLSGFCRVQSWKVEAALRR